MSYFAFRRPDLAKSLCDSLEGRGLIDARSGLFLAAPRRVGKSTFLREDMLPEMETREWVHVYIDLWSDKARDPALLIAEAVKAKIAEFDGVITKAAKAAKLDKVNVLGALTLDLSKPGLPANVTLADALAALQKLARSPVALLIDEAQHALTSQPGLDAMFALKSARDQLNNSAGAPQLMLVLTGSNRDKLAHLVWNRTQPFFGSNVTNFPLLNRTFTDAFTVWVNDALAQGNQFDKDAVFAAFQLVGHRPEMLRSIVGEVAISGEAGILSELLQRGAKNWHSNIWAEMESEFESLTALQKAIIEVLISKPGAFSPFAEESMRRYREITAQPVISTATVQTALEGLRDRNMVWRESRGGYALEDQGFAEWFKQAGLAHAVDKQ